ncbi:VOC family protein [Streptomyces sp. NPDC002913]
MDGLSTPDILARISDGLGDWRKMAQPLAARYRAADPVAGAAFVAAVAQAAAAAGHDVPESRWGHSVIDVFLFSTDAAGYRRVTAEDLELAGVISGIARACGLTALPGEVTQVELGLDTADDAAAGAFWAALLTGNTGRLVADTLFDRSNRVPSVWFQPTEAHRTPRQRWHPDLWVAPEVADERIAAALAAGGTLVDDSGAPSYTVLADPEGNKVCVCTPLGRE